MHTVLTTLHAMLAEATPLDPGDAGWGDVIFVTIWAVGSLLLAAFYCYRSFLTR